jgi:hypothetical protein
MTKYRCGQSWPRLLARPRCNFMIEFLGPLPRISVCAKCRIRRSGLSFPSRFAQVSITLDEAYDRFIVRLLVPFGDTNLVTHRHPPSWRSNPT